MTAPNQPELIVLAEYEESTTSISASQERQLRLIVGDRLTTVPDRVTGGWRIKAGSFVGTVVVPGLRVLVTPKVSTTNLFHLLEAGGEALEVGAEHFEYDRTKDLAPSFATFYARHLERGLSLGIPRSYVEQEERLGTIRGRVDIPAQRRATGLPLPLHCRFDEHTADIRLNRILRAAAVRLARLSGVTVRTRHALVALAGRLDDVGTLEPGDLVAPVLFTRLNQHLRPAERLARTVLDGSTLLHRYVAPGRQAAVFMVDMNKIFEQFIEARLRRYLSGRLNVLGQRSSWLDVRRSVGIRPDLVFETPSGAEVYVADAKYKITTDGRAREHDYYQVLAYVTALRLDEGLLVYCQTDGTAPPREVEVTNSGKRLRTWAVRLDGSPADVERELSRLAHHVLERVLMDESDRTDANTTHADTLV